MTKPHKVTVPSQVAHSPVLRFLSSFPFSVRSMLDVLTVLQHLDVTSISSSCFLFWALKPYRGAGHSTSRADFSPLIFCITVN